jgi:acyl carrier protein
MEDKIKKILVEVCNNGKVLEPDIDLIESGLLDSFAFISFLNELEDIGITIYPTQVDKNSFRTVDSIIHLVNSMVGVK